MIFPVRRKPFRHFGSTATPNPKHGMMLAVIVLSMPLLLALVILIFK